MIRMLLPLAFLLAAALPCTLFENPESTSPTPHAIGKLSFLSGAWVGEAWGGMFHAHYSTPASGEVLSHSKLMKEGSEKFYEFEVFEPRGDGVRLRPYPGGRPAVHLDLVSIDVKARTAVFENPEKDYPTRITYTCPTPDRLVIRLSDPHGGSKKTETFDLRRHRSDKEKEQAR